MKNPWNLLIWLCCLSSYSSYAQLTITTSVNYLTCPGDTNGSASVTVSGGTAPYTYLWLPGGQTSKAITSQRAGNYTLTVTDNAAVDSTLIVTIAQPPVIADNYAVNMPECGANGSVVLMPSGGTPPYQFLWSGGETIAHIAEIAAGDYSVIITDANNCSADFSYYVAEKECFVDPMDYFTPNGDGFNDTWIISNASYFPDAKLIVFNRWGNKVYEHKGTYEPWDGKGFLGVPVPDGVYYYFFYQDKDDKQKRSKHGSVTIIR